MRCDKEAGGLTLRLASYSASRTSQGALLTDEENIHRLAANYRVQPIYQELLHAASGHNASVEGEEATLQWADQNCG